MFLFCLNFYLIAYIFILDKQNFLYLKYIIILSKNQFIIKNLFYIWSINIIIANFEKRLRRKETKFLIAFGSIVWSGNLMTRNFEFLVIFSLQESKSYYIKFAYIGISIFLIHKKYVSYKNREFLGQQWNFEIPMTHQHHKLGVFILSTSGQQRR
jgi:hypothetical protein